MVPQLTSYILGFGLTYRLQAFAGIQSALLSARPTQSGSAPASVLRPWVQRGAHSHSGVRCTTEARSALQRSAEPAPKPARAIYDGNHAAVKAEPRAAGAPALTIVGGSAMISAMLLLAVVARRSKTFGARLV